MLVIEKRKLNPVFRSPQTPKCYQVLGKYYTGETFHTAPPVLLGQCPVCGEFTREELTESFGKCTQCNFSG